MNLAPVLFVILAAYLVVLFVGTIIFAVVSWEAVTLAALLVSIITAITRQEY